MCLAYHFYWSKSKCYTLTVKSSISPPGFPRCPPFTSENSPNSVFPGGHHQLLHFAHCWLCDLSSSRQGLMNPGRWTMKPFGLWHFDRRNQTFNGVRVPSRMKHLDVLRCDFAKKVNPDLLGKKTLSINWPWIGGTLHFHTHNWYIQHCSLDNRMFFVRSGCRDVLEISQHGCLMVAPYRCPPH